MTLTKEYREYLVSLLKREKEALDEIFSDPIHYKYDLPEAKRDLKKVNDLLEFWDTK